MGWLVGWSVVDEMHARHTTLVCVSVCRCVVLLASGCRLWCGRAIVKRAFLGCSPPPFPPSPPAAPNDLHYIRIQDVRMPVT